MRYLLFILIFVSCAQKNTVSSDDCSQTMNDGQIIRDSIFDMNKCYELALKDQPHLEGKIQFDFDLGSTGQVTSSQVSKTWTTINDEELSACLKKITLEWKFADAAASGKTKTCYRMMFKK